MIPGSYNNNSNYSYSDGHIPHPKGGGKLCRNTNFNYDTNNQNIKNELFNLQKLIFEVRNEYINYDEKLKELKSYIETNLPNYTTDFDIRIKKINDNIMFYFLLKYDNILGELNKLLKTINLIKLPEIYFVKADNNGSCIFDEKTSKKISIIDQTNFKKISNSIINSDFVQNINLTAWHKDNNYDVKLLYFVDFIYSWGTYSNKPFSISYSPIENIIKTKNINNDELLEILYEIKIPIGKFSEYHSNIIQKNSSPLIDIIKIEDEYKNKKTNIYKVEESYTKTILKKIKKY